MGTADLLVAVDGDGTRTRAAVADLEGRILARGFGPSSDLQTLDLEEVGRALTTAIEGALLQVPGAQWKGEGPIWRSGRVAAACLGLAGVDSKEDEARLSGWLKDRALAEHISVRNDGELVLASGTPDGIGVALISATGSIALGRAPDGRTVRVGGWGPLAGDEGSGYALALRTLHLATQTADGRAQAASLLRAALTHFAKPDATSLVRHLHDAGTSPADIASLATTVLDLAARGDQDAAALVDESARELTEHVRVVVSSLRLQRPALALAGGMMRGQLRGLIVEGLGELVGAVNHVTDPVLGALALARRMLASA